ncbi:MAG: MauE/DoxX family redox-associated membrane protein [Acidimicrobiales bacterium]
MLVGLVHALALLLLVAAAAKLADPEPATVALGQAGLPSGPLVVRLLATAEAAVAAATLLVGGVVPALALGLLHLGFAAFIARLRRAAGAKATCGCFGEAEAPVDRLHVVVNLVAAGVVAVALAFPLPSVPSVLDGQVGLALPYVTAVVIGAWATGLCLTSLPSLLAAQRQVVP